MGASERLWWTREWDMSDDDDGGESGCWSEMLRSRPSPPERRWDSPKTQTAEKVYLVFKLFLDNMCKHTTWWALMFPFPRHGMSPAHHHWLHSVLPDWTVFGLDYSFIILFIKMFQFFQLVIEIMMSFVRVNENQITYII